MLSVPSLYAGAGGGARAEGAGPAGWPSGLSPPTAAAARVLEVRAVAAEVQSAVEFVALVTTPVTEESAAASVATTPTRFLG